MKFISLILSFLLCICFSCKKENPQTQNKKIQTEKKIQLENELYDFSSRATVETEDWTEFKSFTTSINEIKENHQKPRIENIEKLETSLKNALDSIPIKINLPSLSSRFKVIDNQIGLYKDYTKNAPHSSIQNAKQVDKIIDSYNHIIFQVNDIVEKLDTEEKYKDLK